MNIADILQYQSQKRPDAPAIIDVFRGCDRIITFAELERASAQGASLLLEYGMSRGDTALVFQPVSAELYIALMALFRLGMTAMFIDPSAGREYIELCSSIQPPAALIATPRAHLLSLCSPVLWRIRQHFSFGSFLPGSISWKRSKRLKPHLTIAPCEADAPALITFTSGSTGQPKAAVRSHGFLLDQHRVLERAIHLTPGDIDLITLPVFVLANMASGVTSLIPDANLRYPGKIKAEPVLRQIKRYSPSSIIASPAFLERICDSCESFGTIVTGFKYVFTGGAPVFPDHLNRFATIFSHAEVVAVYGSTEAEPIALIAKKEITDIEMEAMFNGAGLLAGIPVEEIRVRVISAQWGTPLGTLDEEEFSVICLPTGESGEIVVSGKHVLKGYLKGIGDKENKFRVNNDIWHRTGDSGYFDESGRLWLLGRISAVINDDRGVLYPFAVECATRQFSPIVKAAVVSRQGKRILFVQERKGLRVDTEAVRHALSWAQLDKVRVLDKIPLDRRHNAKVDYGSLEKIS